MRVPRGKPSTGARGDGSPLLGPPRRLLRRRGQRPDFGLVCLSALGFYPVCPASDEYVVGSPLFRKAVVNLENGNKIVLEAPDNSPENRYIGAVQFDGKSYTHNFLRHSDLVKGAGVRFSMRPEPDYTRGTEPGDAPYSFSRE